MGTLHEDICTFITISLHEDICTFITISFHEDLCTFITISRRILLRIRNVSDQGCRKN